MCKMSKKMRIFAQKFRIENMMAKQRKGIKSTNADKTKKSSGLTVKEWALEDRPREKLLQKGKKELSNAELIAILIGSGTAGQSAVDVAKEILNRSENSLSKLSRQSIKELTKNFKGIGEAKAISITAALELGYRLLNENSDQKEYTIKDSLDLFNFISPSLIDLPYEEFWAIYLNVKNKVIFKQRISSGGLTETGVDHRKIFSTALEKNATSIAVAHNHPSGITEPSLDDKRLTKSIIDAGKLLRINLIEHIIVGIDGKHAPTYYSFHDHGLI